MGDTDRNTARPGMCWIVDWDTWTGGAIVQILRVEKPVVCFTIPVANEDTIKTLIDKRCSLRTEITEAPHSSNSPKAFWKYWRSIGYFPGTTTTYWVANCDGGPPDD